MTVDALLLSYVVILLAGLALVAVYYEPGGNGLNRRRVKITFSL